MDVQSMSESVYVGMCHKIGTPQQVTARRDIVDIMDLLDNQNNLVKSMRTGSDREGFRLRGSDMDTMYWHTDHRVIWDFSQSEFYNTHRQILILCDSSESPPGFTLLWLPFKHANIWILSACVRMHDRLYISSSKHRDFYCTSISPNSTVHGPCATDTLGTVQYGTIDHDSAFCFASDFWPPSASSWIDRCHSWPPPHVVNSIVRNGCHFVAIGYKLGNHEDNEWRISFSQAENKLVYSMNYTQFLTYGLLKLFLKEIINNEIRDEETHLCSYHMKTAIFWAIQQNTLPQWCPQNLLNCFWVCFKILLKWVYEGICPNFFIPENNMFQSKIHGQAQTSLFRRLYGLYEKYTSISLLLHSSSIRSSIIYVFCNPRLTVCTDEHTLISEAEFDVELFGEIHCNDTQHQTDLQQCMKSLHTVEQLIGSPLSQYQVVSLQKYTASILQSTAFTLHNIYTNTSVNRQVYVTKKLSCHMLNLAAKFGCVSDMLYVAMYYYKTCRYREALSVIEMTKVKLSRPYVMYNERVDKERYTEAVGGQSLSTKMRQAVAMDIKLHNEICYISELLPEQQSSRQNRIPYLHIPPFVLLLMLEFLSSRHVDTMRAQTSLYELQVLILHDQGLYISNLYRDISWEILGICQQITGNLQASLFSYQQCLRQVSLHELQTSTRQRIYELHMPT
ncbi:uncharacterized protein [Magallana gigas]|uniref:uncharacterized protein n=1 Tax=Magallana gigas TaxID=29159 RepID=UPI00333FDDDD